MKEQFNWEPHHVDLTDLQVKEVIEAWQKDFGETITDAFARLRGTALFTLYSMLTDFLRWDYARARKQGVTYDEYMNSWADRGVRDKGTLGMSQR